MESTIKISNAFALSGCSVLGEERILWSLLFLWCWPVSVPSVLSALTLGCKSKVRRMLSITDVTKS